MWGCFPGRIIPKSSRNSLPAGGMSFPLTGMFSLEQNQKAAVAALLKKEGRVLSLMLLPITQKI